ncbi:MAG: glycosyltransferase family 4 protein [Firmicutes bacterium]|nr:glycosyltransferase family 4 protein [Bacillota bacterium]
MRVLMFSWEYPPRIVGGLARHVAELSAALAETGAADVHVITINEDTASPDEEIIGGVHVWRVRPYRLVPRDFISGILQYNLAMLEKALSLFLAGYAFDLLHAHDWLVAYAARAVKHAARRPLVATIHATEYGRNQGLYTDEQRYISDVEWWLTYEAWKVICCSTYMFHELQRVFHLPDDKIAVIPNGVDVRQFADGKLDAKIRERYAVPEEKIVFFVGRLVREKGVHVLLDAAPQVLAAEPKVKFIVAGKGPALEALRHQAKNMGLETRFCFTGYIDDDTRNALYRTAAVAVFPSLYEPFGIVALEAMAAGVPVVVSDTGGLAAIVRHGETGLKCCPGDAASLASQIIALLKNPILAGRLARQAKALVEKEYAWQEIARQTRKIYLQVLSAYNRSDWILPPLKSGGQDAFCRDVCSEQLLS